MNAATQSSPFNLRTVIIMLAAGLLAAAAFVVLLAYAPDLRSGNDGGAHPLSLGGTGYHGIVELLDDLGVPTTMVRDEDGVGSAGLLVVTLSPMTDPAGLKEIVRLRKGKPTLYVLPKWATIPDDSHGGWVQRVGVDPTTAQELLSVLAPSLRVASTKPPVPEKGERRPRQFVVGSVAQWLTGTPMTPLLQRFDVPVLASTGDGRMFILADPDLIANHGLKNRDTAALAVEMISGFGPTTGRSPST